MVGISTSEIFQRQIDGRFFKHWFWADSDHMRLYGARAEHDISYAAIRSSAAKWPDAEVPYTLDGAFSQHERSTILSAMNEIERSTCVQFRNKNRLDSIWLHFRHGRISFECLIDALCMKTDPVVAVGRVLAAPPRMDHKYSTWASTAFIR